MRFLLFLAIALSAAAGRTDEPADLQNAAPAKTVGDQDHPTPASERRVLVYRVKHIAAGNLAESVGRLLEGEQNADVIIIPEPIGNQLLISGARKTLSPVVEILEQMDRSPCQIQLELLFLHGGDEIGNDLSPKKVAELIRNQRETISHSIETIQLTAVENQPVTVQVGERQPRVVGTQLSRAGRTNTVQMEESGTLVKLTAACPDRKHITVQLEYESSRMGPAELGQVIASPEEGERIRASSTYIRQLELTILLQDGETKVIRAARGATNCVVAAVTASVVPEQRD